MLPWISPTARASAPRRSIFAGPPVLRAWSPCPAPPLTRAPPIGDSWPACDLAQLRRIARLGKELNLWDDKAHVWGEDSCCTVDGIFWTLELVVGRRVYRATGCTYGARFGLCQRLLGLKPTPSWDY